MLLELSIRNFAIIKEIKVNFNQGLHVLTGETGAGKSIIIDAISLIAGGRGSVEFINNSANKAELEALFDIPDTHAVHHVLVTLGIEPPTDGLLIIRRELLSSGKSICRINGQLVTLGMLKEIGNYLIQMVGQFQTQQLLSPEKQLLLLDAYGEEKLGKTLKEYTQIYRQYYSIKKELDHFLQNEKEIASRLDILRYQWNEITAADLLPEEEEDLTTKRNKIRYSEKILKGLSNVHQVFSNENGINEMLSYATSLLDSLRIYDQEIDKLNEELNNIYFQFEDYSTRIYQLIQNYELDYSIEQVNQIEERLSLIHHLKRKYGENIGAILEYAATIEEELEIIENKDDHLNRLQSKLKQIEQDLVIEVNELSSRRKTLAKLLSKVLENELKDLEMKNAQFYIDIVSHEDPNGIEIHGDKVKIDEHGIDKVTFMFSPNPGEPLKQLNKIASGGELSRIMLAIQNILAHQDDIPTIIFDEIDTGVSGRAAQAIAEKLASVAKTKQILVITHLPQVAVMGDHQYLIEKKVQNKHTYTEINLLDEEKRVEEICRMLGGVEITETTKKHAQELLIAAETFKTID